MALVLLRPDPWPAESSLAMQGTDPASASMGCPVFLLRWVGGVHPRVGAHVPPRASSACAIRGSDIGLSRPLSRACRATCPYVSGRALHICLLSPSGSPPGERRQIC